MGYISFLIPSFSSLFMINKSLLKRTLYAVSFTLGLSLVVYGANINNHKSFRVKEYESLEHKIKDYDSSYQDLRTKDLSEYMEFVARDSSLLGLLLKKEELKKDPSFLEEMTKGSNNKDLSELCYMYGLLLICSPFLYNSYSKEKALKNKG